MKKKSTGKMPITMHETLERCKQYQFYKYRLSWSSQITDWKIVRLPEGYDAKDYFAEVSNDNSWSEHFHGVEYKKCKPTPMWLEKQILNLRDRAHDITQLADDYCWILDTLCKKKTYSKK